MYTVGIQQRARRALARIPEDDSNRILAAIRGLASNPRPVGCVKLSGREAWRLRTGMYRIIYEINDTELTVLVVDVGHRRDVYR
jgi:mRNA interferase RelE/StbE